MKNDIKIGQYFHDKTGTELKVIRIFNNECVVEFTRGSRLNQKELLTIQDLITYYNKGLFPRDTQNLTWMDIKIRDVFEFIGNEGEYLKHGRRVVIRSYPKLHPASHKTDYSFIAKFILEPNDVFEVAPLLEIKPQNKQITHWENLPQDKVWKFIENEINCE